MDEEKITVDRVERVFGSAPMEVEDGKQVWRSCCFDADKEIMVWIGQMMIMVLVLCFCAVMLIAADGSCDKSSPYIGLISFVLGKALSSVVDSHANK